MDIGRAIRMIRQTQHLTQTELAERCYMSTNSICRLETGKAFPPQSTIDLICRKLNVPQGYILLSSIEENDFPEDKRILFRTQLVPLRDELLK